MRPPRSSHGPETERWLTLCPVVCNFDVQVVTFATLTAGTDMCTCVLVPVVSRHANLRSDDLRRNPDSSSEELEFRRQILRKALEAAYAREVGVRVL